MGETGDDRVLRAMTNDGGFRVITAKTTHTVREAVRAQQASGETARAFGELLTGAVLYRETMAPHLRVQAILDGAGGRGRIVADSMPEGGSRGLVRLPKGVDRISTRGGAVLQMMRTMPKGELHRGVVQVPADGNLSSAMMAYLQSSEQVLSMLSVGCKMDGDEVVAAGGYVVQILPELDEHLLMLMTERLEDFRVVEKLFEGVAASAESLMHELLYGIEHTTLDNSALRFECTCSEVRVLASLGTLSRGDLEDLMRDGTDLEMSCDYCNKEYRISPERLRGMLEPA